MLKKILFSAILAVFLCAVAQAQDDSLYYDLGRVLVKKSAVQATTISGKDLEKYQASNLSDAINVWINGTYTSNTSITYVIDGNIITDVNAYSIYDIEEVTLIQSAIAQSSGASPGQQMVLIKTRTDRSGKRGIELTGQNSQVDLRNQANTPGVSSSNNTYDQYYLAGYRNFKNANIGVTAEYQRDVDPSLTGNGFELLTPANYNRFKFYGYANAKLGKKSTLIFGINYVPQTNHYAYNLDTLSNDFPAQPEKVAYVSRLTQHLLASNFGIKSDIAKGFTNRFSVAYSHYNNFEADSTAGVATTSGYTGVTQAVSKAHNMLVRDYLTYHGQFNNWHIESTINLTYRDFADSLNYQSIELTESQGTTPSTVTTIGHYDNHYKNLMANPSVDIYYKDFFDAQGGFIGLLNSGKVSGTPLPVGHVYPFLSSTLDLARMVGITFVKWRLFASYSRQSPVLTDDISTLSTYNLAPAPGTVDYFAATYKSSQQFNSYQTGTTVGILKNLTADYTYQYKYGVAITDIPLNANVAFLLPATPVNSKTVTSRFALHYSLNTSFFNWSASLNGTESKLQIVDNPALEAAYNAAYLGAGHRWTGGYTNRFDYKIVFWGADFLYQAGQRPTSLINSFIDSPTYIPPSNNNSITLQNCYFGTRIKIPHVSYAEVYVNTRNILQNNSSTITDNRRFVGGGVKAGF